MNTGNKSNGICWGFPCGVQSLPGNVCPRNLFNKDYLAQVVKKFILKKNFDLTYSF